MFFFASIVAVFVDTVAQAPVVVKVLQSAPEPEWKWWLGALAPWVGPLLSGAVSIYVAWKVFRWQGEKDRYQWVLEQMRAEWRELLSLLNSVYFPMALAKQMKQPLPLEGSQKQHELSQCFQDRVFIDAAILLKFQVRSEQYALEYLGQSEGEPSSEDEKSKVLDKLKSLTIEVRESAKRDLEVRCKPINSPTKEDEP